MKIAPKVAQDSKEKSRKSAVRGEKIPRNYRAKRRGGGGFHPPPGLIRVKAASSFLTKQNYFVRTQYHLKND